MENIFKAVLKYKKMSYEKDKYKTDLSEWANSKKILLLNSALTHSSPNKNIIQKHMNAWETFVQEIIAGLLKRQDKSLAIFLWGIPAQKTFFKCLNENSDLDFIAKCIRENIDSKYISRNKKFKIGSDFRVIRKEEPITAENKRIKIFFTNHPSPRNENINTGKFIDYSSKYHFKECDEMFEKTWENILIEK